MTQVCCPACRLRIAPAAAPDVAGCPSCGEQLRVMPAAEAVGFALYSPQRAIAPTDIAMAVANLVAHDPRS
jgi:hypothetical protein